MLRLKVALAAFVFVMVFYAALPGIALADWCRCPFRGDGGGGDETVFGMDAGGGDEWAPGYGPYFFGDAGGG